MRLDPGKIVAAVTTLTLAAAIGATPAVAARCPKNTPPRTIDDFATPGPYPVGVRTVTWVDASRPTQPNGTYAGAPDRTLVTEIWYPAVAAGRDEAFDPSGGPYPVIIQSHGFSDFRTGESEVTSHLASRGYIVAAPDFPLSNLLAPGGPTVADIQNQPGDVSFVLDHVLAEYGSDADATRIGASGLSLGGLTTWLVTYHPLFRDPRIRAAVGMAGLACIFRGSFFRTVDTPRLILQGDSDLVVQFKENGRHAFRAGPAARHLVELREGSHLGFSVVATGNDGSTHLDTLACQALAGGFGPGVDLQDNPFSILGGPALGLKRDPSGCPLPCTDPIPPEGSMGGDRQHELTLAAVTAFFEGYLRGDVPARCYLGKPMSAENDDVKARLRARKSDLLGP
jgi:predicted dienelactone hydrolase